jgi:hypothetical protein
MLDGPRGVVVAEYINGEHCNRAECALPRNGFDADWIEMLAPLVISRLNGILMNASPERISMVC